MQNCNHKIVAFGFLAAILASMVFMSGGIKNVLAQTSPATPSTTHQGPASDANSTTTSSSMSNMNMSKAGTTNKTTVTRDSTTVLLEGKTIPGKGFIHLYDSTPYMINAGHIALHVPCDASSKPVVDVLIGPAPNFTKVQPDIIQVLSQPGKMCLYHVDINSDPAKKIYQTDVAIQNPSDKPILFPASSGVVIGVNEIQPGVPGG
jgi:hypothetical protein